MKLENNDYWIKGWLISNAVFIEHIPIETGEISSLLGLMITFEINFVSKYIALWDDAMEYTEYTAINCFRMGSLLHKSADTKVKK